VRLVFLGSGAFAVPSLEALLDAGHEVRALVTQPDREKGRGRALASPPTRAVAEARGVPVLQPRRVREPEAQEQLRRLGPELQVVVAFGPRGTVNVHGSRPPRLRGAAPIQWAIANGDTETGVSTMLIDEGLDTGPVLLQRATPIGPEERASELEPRLARLGAQLLLETLRGLEDGSLRPVPQDPARATLAPLLHKEDGRLDWRRPARELHDRARGFHPWPGAFTSMAGRMLKVLRTRLTEAPPVAADAVPGEVLDVSDQGLLVLCGEGTGLRLVEVQPESRRAMPARAFAAGARLARGARFD
jgi:methionyl-tRNA formyltransferase